MTSTNDGKDVKNSQIFGQKAKTYYIELYKTLEARLSVESELGARTSLLCEAWRRVHCLCQHSATSTHPHLISWLQRHTAQTILQSEWRQTSIHQDKHDALGAAIDFFIYECHEAIITRNVSNPQWETQLLQRAEWFKSVIPDPWGNAVLKALLDPRGEVPTDQQIVEWLKEERGVFFVTRLRQLASSKKTVDIALSLASAVMERVRACAAPVSDTDAPNKVEQSAEAPPTFTDVLTMEAGFTVDVWELITDIEFVLLYSERSKCIALAKQTPLKNGYQLVERLHCRLDISSREKRLWKNAKDVAILIAQVMVARCMVVATCVGTARSTLYGCARSLVKLLPAERLPGAMAALAAPAATARHLHTLAVAVDAQCKNERKPFVCELYIRAITAGMNELEKLKLTKEKEAEARMAEKLLGSWFTSLGALLGASARLAYECALTAFSLHPSPAMYDRICTAPQLQPAPVNKDIQEPAAETNSEFGSWATDSRSQTNFVKTSETLNLKKIQQHSNVLSTAVLNEGEALGLSPELCQDLIVLLSGPRVKTLSWDMDKSILIENCRSYMERTHGGTRAVTTELKYLNLDPDSFMHLPEEEDEDEGDIYYGIEKGYEHLVELHEPEEIWKNALSEEEISESYYSSENETFIYLPKGRKKGKPRRHSCSTEEEALDPLSDIVLKTKRRSHSSESNKRTTKEHSKERSKERKKKDGQAKEGNNSTNKSQSQKDNESNTIANGAVPIAVDVVKLLQKPKKERKKREKKVKTDTQKQIKPPTGLSRLIGKKVIKTNMFDKHPQVTQRESETDLNNQVFISDSDYDSQGKSSIASMHTEGNDPDVLFDGLFSMDDIKSPDKTSVTTTDMTSPLHPVKYNTTKRKPLIDNAIPTVPSINFPDTFYVQKDFKDKELMRSTSVTPTSARNVNELRQLPPWSSSNTFKNDTLDEVKLGIKRLIEFRKQKSATELFSKTKHESDIEHQTSQNKRKNHTVNKKVNNKFGLENRTENESRILPGSPKAISVPDIPKVFINKQQSLQLNQLKNEVDNYLLNQGNNTMEYQAYVMNNEAKPEMRRNDQHPIATSVKSDNPVAYANLNKFEQKVFNIFQQSESSKMTNNIPNTSVFKEPSSNIKHNRTGKNVPSHDQNKLSEFFKELHRSNNAGVSKNNRSRVSGIKINTDSLSSGVPVNSNVKQNKPFKKVENAPNTFARLNYLHKTKQGDNVSKQNSELLANKMLKSYNSESIKDKNNIIIDTLLSRVDCTVIRKEKSPQKKVNSLIECPSSTGVTNVGPTVTKKAVITDNRLGAHSNVLHSQATAPTHNQSTRTLMPRTTMLTSCNEDQLRDLQRQNSKCLTRPQIRPEVASKGVNNTQVPNLTPSFDSQSLCKQLTDVIYNRLNGCPIKVQSGQNVPSRVQNVGPVQSKFSSVTTTNDIPTKSNVRHKSGIVKTKETNICGKSEKRSNSGQQDWESVLNDLLSHKTPARNSNTQVTASKKEPNRMPRNISCDQRMNNLDTTNDTNLSIASTKLDKGMTAETALKNNKPIIYPKSNATIETNITSMLNNAPLVNNTVIYTKAKTSPIIKQSLTMKRNDQNPVRKSNQTTIIKRVGKTSEVKLPFNKDLGVSIPQTHTDSVITNVPSSEYDILGELMDDDLRKEIGELSSDEESFSGTNVAPKGKVKGLSSKIINMMGYPDSSCNSNIRQNQSNLNKQVTPTLQSAKKVPEPQVRSMTTSSEIINVKSKPLHNIMHINDNEKCQPRIHYIPAKANTYNIIQQTSKPIMPLNMQQRDGREFLDNNNSSINKQITDSPTSNISMPLQQTVQQIGICNNQNIVNDSSRLITAVNQNIVNDSSRLITAVNQNIVNDSSRLITAVNQTIVNDSPRLIATVNQNSGNVFNAAVPQQHTAIQNVVLIRPEFVYEPYTVQVHQIPKTICPSIGNTNKYVAVNAVPTISMFGGQFPNPVINPLIIGKTIAVPIPNNNTSQVNNTCNNNSSLFSNSQLHTTSGANNKETEIKSSPVESKPASQSNVCDLQNVNKIMTKPESISLSEKSTRINHLIQDIPKAYVKIDHSSSRKNSEGAHLNENSEKDIVSLPYSIKRGNAVEPVESMSGKRRDNVNDCNKDRSIIKDSTSNILPITGKYPVVHGTVMPRLETKANMTEGILNNGVKSTVFSKVPEKHELFTSSCTANNIETDKNLTKCGNGSGGLGYIKTRNVLEKSNSHVSTQHCTMVEDVVSPYPKTDIKISDYMLHKKSEKKVLSKLEVNRNLTTSCCRQRSSNNTDEENVSKECEHHINTLGLGKVESTPKKLMRPTLRDTCPTVDKIIIRQQVFPHALDNGHTQYVIPTVKVQDPMVDIVHCNIKADEKLKDCPSTKSCERKVLSEVQEKHTVVIPEKTILKASIAAEDEIKKEFIKTREERLKRKKSAILNRQIHIFSDVEPIPLTYAPINTFKAVPDIKHISADKVSADFVYRPKTKISEFNATVITNENNELKDFKSDNSTDVLLIHNPNGFKPMFIDSSKENNESNTTEGRLVRHRASNKEVGKPTILPQNEKLNINNTPNKAKSKVKKIKDGSNLNKFKTNKRLMKKSSPIMEYIKRDNIHTTEKDINNLNLVKPVPTKNIDIEEQLQGSIISKKCQNEMNVHTHKEVSNNKNDLQNIALRKTVSHSSVNDKSIKNKLKDIDQCNVNAFSVQKDITNEKINKTGKLEDSKKNDSKLDLAITNSVLPCESIKLGDQACDEIITLNDNTPNVIKNKQISTSKEMSPQSGDGLSGGEQVCKSIDESNDTLSKLSNCGKSPNAVQEALDDNKLIDSYKDSIIIEELPRKKDDDPFKRCISIKLANGNCFKATVSGKLQVDINSLFEDPAIRSVLMNKIHTNTRCILNIQQVVSASGENIRTRVVDPNKKHRNLETINLISDDEEESVQQVFNTEYGKFKVQGLNDYIFNEHQKKLSQKCSVKLEKCTNRPDNNRPFPDLSKNKGNQLNDSTSINRSDNESMQLTDSKFSKVNDSTEDKNDSIIEIDDSSSDSVVTNLRSINVSTQPLTESDNIELNIKDVKETLLKDSCVDTNSKIIDASITNLTVDIPRELENLKETLLKDLCDDLGNSESKKIENGRKHIITDVEIGLKNICENALLEKSKKSDIHPIDASKNIESCNISSTIKEDLFICPGSEIPPVVKSLKDIESVLPTAKNQLSWSKRFQLKIEKCDDLVKKYELLKGKQCFVSLERCDMFINSQIRSECKTHTSKVETIQLNNGERTKENCETIVPTELDSSNCTLKRCGSFSILNDMNLCDQSVKLLKPLECDTNDRIIAVGNISKSTGDLHSCLSDWHMTKPIFNYMMDKVTRNKVISDDISTDCDSDHDDNFSIEEDELCKGYMPHQVPSLLQVALKVFSITCEYFEPNKRGLSTNNFSMQGLKRKSSLPEDTLSDSKVMKLDDGTNHLPDNGRLSVKNHENSFVELGDRIKIVDCYRNPQNYDDVLHSHCAILDKIIKNDIHRKANDSVTPILPNHHHDSVMHDDAYKRYKKVNLNNKLIKNNFETTEVYHSNSTSLQKEALTLIDEQCAANMENDDISYDTILKEMYAEDRGFTKIPHEITNEQNNMRAEYNLKFRSEFKEDKKEDVINFNKKFDKNNLNHLDCSLIDIPENKSKLVHECINSHKINAQMSTSHKNNKCCENIIPKLNSESHNALYLKHNDISSTTTETMYINGGNKESKYPSVEKTQLEEYSKITAEIDSPKLKDLKDKRFMSNETHIVVKCKLVIPNVNLTNLDTSSGCNQRQEIDSTSSINTSDMEHVDNICENANKIAITHNNSGILLTQEVDNKDNLVFMNKTPDCKNNSEFLEQSASSEICNKMCNADRHRTNNTKHCETINILTNVKLNEVKENFKELTDYVATISDTEYLGQSHSTELLKCEQHPSLCNNIIEKFNKILDHDEKIQPVNMLSVNEQSDLNLSKNMLEKVCETNLFSQQNSTENRNDVICTEQHTVISTKNTKEYSIEIDTNSVDTHKNTENKISNPNMISKSTELYPSKLVFEPHSLFTSNRVKKYEVNSKESDKLTNVNDDVVLKSSMNSKSNVILADHSDNIVINCKLNRTDNITQINDNSKDSDAQTKSLDNINKLRSETKKDNVTLTTSGIFKSQIEPLELQEENLIPEQQIILTKNKMECDVLSKGIDKSTVVDISSIEFDTAKVGNNNNKKDLTLRQVDLDGKFNAVILGQSNTELHSRISKSHQHRAGTTNKTKAMKRNEQSFNDKSIDMEYVVIVSNKAEESCNSNCDSISKNNKLDTKTKFVNLDKLEHSEHSSQVNLIDTSSTVTSDEISDDLEDTTLSKNMDTTVHIMNQVRNGNKDDSKSETTCSKQLISMNHRNNVLMSAPCDTKYNVSNMTNVQKSPETEASVPDSHKNLLSSEVLLREEYMNSYNENRDSTKNKCGSNKRKVIENNLSINFDLSGSKENNIKTDKARYDENEDIRENKVNETSTPKNITLLYESDSKVILKGSIIEDPVVGTCYVFPIISSEILRPAINNDDNCIMEDKSTAPDVFGDHIQDADLIVTKPKVTYSNTNLKVNYYTKTSMVSEKVSKRNLKRKFESVDSKIINKKYRKGKNIDHPKTTVAAVRDFGYTKEFQNLSNYCDSIKFSYTKQYHLIQLDDVHTMLKDWPIKESNLSTSNESDIGHDLFVDIEQKALLPDPTEQTLAEEILAIYEEKESTSPVINEINFSMGFGERSDRVDQTLLNGEKSTKISAVTLSDVKQSQPCLQSVFNDEPHVSEILESRDKQLQILNKCYSYIRLRDQVQSFFRKTAAELNYTWLKNNFKSEKKKSTSNELLDTMSNFPFDLNRLDFFEPPSIENIVQVVQVGQLPVSTGAQNPITCDPRVTRVSDASPPQCSVENGHDDIQPTIKTEYTELTTADISLPLMPDYDEHHQGLISASQNSNLPACNDNITIETEVKIEVLEDVSDNMDDQGRYENKEYPTFSNDQITNTEFSFDVNGKVPIKTEEPDVKIVFEPAEGNVDINQIPETYELQQHRPNVPLEKPDQLAHAMSAAGITTTPEPIADTAMDLTNSISHSVGSEQDSNNYPRSNITAMALQQALAQILPPSLNQSNESETNPQVSVASQILHIVHGKNTSLNQITLSDSTQQSVISTATPTPVLHIVQSKNGPNSSCSNGSPIHNSNSYSGLSLVDTGLSQGGNQLLHIVNTGNQKSNNAAQLLKRVNLLTNITNVQGTNEQKMVQFVCKSTDAKGIQLNNQRSMVLRLHTIESPQATQSKTECQDSSPKESPTKESIVPQELKSRSVYEENYAKFIQNSSKQPVIEKSTSLPKFNQAFGKPVFQEENQKSNDIEASDAHIPSEDNNIENNDCQPADNSMHLDNIRQIASPPLLLRKSSTHTTAQQNLVQQIKQAITPMNIQTMHGGVIYTRQIPVNIGGGQTINLITVPSTERIDDSTQKQKTDIKFGSRSEIEPSIIKIVPQSSTSSNSEVSAEESNNVGGVSNENVQNTHAPPMLTQMRIKLPMLSKNPQMVSAARVVRPSFFQIQRNVIGGPNQPVYQQLVLTTAPTLGQQSIRLPHTQTSREIKVGTESQTSAESQMSSSTLEQLREFDMVLEQVKERSTVQPNGTPSHDFSKSQIISTDTSEIATTISSTRSTPSEVTTQQVLYSIGNTQSVNVAYVNRKSTVLSTSATTSFARSPDSSGIVESPTSSSHVPSTHAAHTVTSETTNGNNPPLNHHKSTKVTSKPKSRPKSHHPQFKINALPPKPSNQKPMEDEQTTQRILYILAEYKEQVENSPDKDKPAPRRRTNLQASVTPPGGSKRKKSSSGSRRSGRDSSPLDDSCRTMGSEDSSCGTSQGDCNETCQDLPSPQSSPRKVAKKLSFDQDSPVSQSRPQSQQSLAQPQLHQSQIHKQAQPQLQRNVLVTDGPTIAVTRAAPGKPATAVLMPANYILPVSMVKSGQQIAIVTNRGPKILTVGGGEGGATNALLLQRLISPTGLKPMLARPGVRHVRLPTTALHNLQAFNLATAASAPQQTETATSPVPATSPPELVDTKAPRSPWTVASRDSDEVKPEQDSSPQRPDQEQELESETQPHREPEPDPDPDPEPWNVPHDYSYEETVRTEMDRTVLDAIPDRYSPDMEAQRIFDKMFDVESKKGYIDSQDDSPRCPYDIDASDCDDKAYHQVVQRRDGVTNRHRFVSAATLRQKFALMEDELRLQKSLSEECEDLGVDSPSASDLFPEAELLFSSSPAHEVSQQSHTPQPVILNQSSAISKPDLDDQAATDHLISREVRQPDDIDLGLEDVGIVTVSEDGMRATISLDHEEFVRSHPNTTFHSELTEEGEVQPVTLADLKARHITSTIFHAGRAPATVLVTAPQTTVISQATPDGSGVDHVRCSHADNLNHDAVTRFDILNENREATNTTSAIIHSTGNATQVIRRVCYEREARYFLDDDLMNDPKMADDSRDAALESVDEDRSSPERHPELFWENPRPRENRRVDFSSDSDKCCKSPYEENNSTDSNMGVNMRLDSVIKDARGIDRSESSVEDSAVPPLRTYPPKRTYHHDGHRTASGKTKNESRPTEGSEGKRRASNRGVVKRGCHCCNGTTAPPKPKKPRQRKPTLDFN